jgi:hypothetical protein
VGRAPSRLGAVRSALTGTPYRTGVLVLTLVTLVLRAYAVSRSTWIDDDWIFMHQSG